MLNVGRNLTHVAIVFLDPDFLQNAKISAIRVFKADIGLLNICMGFQDLLTWNGGLVEQNRGKGGAILTPKALTNSFFLLGVLTSVPILVNIDEEMRPWECSQTNRLTEANRFYNLSNAIWSRCGTDKAHPQIQSKEGICGGDMSRGLGRSHHARTPRYRHSCRTNMQI